MSIVLTLLGTGCPRPDPERSQTAIVADVDGRRLLLDCGGGTVRRLLEAGIAPESISALVLTHLHVDHMFDYAPIVYAAWFRGRSRLPVLGPVGTRELTRSLFEGAYRPEIAKRTEGGRFMQEPPRPEVSEFDAAGPILRAEGCAVSVLPVVHNAPSETFALRIEDGGGHVVAISSDTAYHEPLASFARGADLLVHECYLCGAAYERYDTALRREMQQVHSTPEQAGRIAALAGAGSLVLTHFLTGVDEAAVVAGVRTEFGGPVTVGRDLMRFEVG